MASSSWIEIRLCAVVWFFYYGYGFVELERQKDIVMKRDRGKRDRAGEASIETRQSREENQRALLMRE